ncbi:MAG TPA: lysylphosphatidylglycerol synthase transmembrane domain-containing protein [Thermomicrobiales bacterium]|nr:lysylphosphatidylglycerol synthase transmembrane domain-containing protein [Thermomicrobiales bacterium]
MIKRAFVVSIVLAIVGVLAYLADIELLVRALEALPPQQLALLVGVFLFGALVKGLRWAFYLRAAKLDIRWRDGMTTYLAAMTTSPLPGGSWLAPRLAQEHGHVRMRQAAPAVFFGFIVDAITVPTLVFILFLATDQPRYSFVVPLVGLGLGITLFSVGRSQLVWNFVSRQLARTRFTRGWLPKEQDIQIRVRALMRPGPVLGGIIFSLGATLCSAAFLMVIVDALTIRGLQPLEALWIHTVSETAGIAIPIPGGFGVTDSSIAGMLNRTGIGLTRATFLALILRSMSVVFRVFFGTLFLFLYYDRFLLSVLDIRGRTRNAYRRAITIPGLKQTLRPLAAALHLRHRQPVAPMLDIPGPIEEGSVGD